MLLSIAVIPVVGGTRRVLVIQQCWGWLCGCHSVRCFPICCGRGWCDLCPCCAVWKYVYEVWRTVQRKSHVSCSCSWVCEGKHDAGKGDRAILSWQLRVLALESFMFKFVLFLFYLFIQNIKLPLTYFHTSCRMLVLTCKHDVFRKLYNCTPYQSFWSPPKKVCW